MRSFVVAIGLLAFAASADAKPRQKTSEHKRDVKRQKRTDSKRIATSDVKREKQRGKRGRAAKRLAHATRRERRDRFVIHGPITGQSLGAPWAGRLRMPAELPAGDGYVLRRPWRAFGTRSTVDFVERILTDIADRFPDIHDIAVGDISAKEGGRISEHSSHQSGRDIDIGLIFLQKPAAYPDSFVVGTGDNLDLEATFVLVEEFAKTAKEEGGAQVIFLDFKVQGLLYDWALENGETEESLARLFQYPHGRGSSEGIVRHEPNHADHIHVRFRCPPADGACR